MEIDMTENEFVCKGCKDCADEVKTMLQEQVQTMEQEQTRLQELSQKEQKSKGLFGWIWK